MSGPPEHERERDEIAFHDAAAAEMRPEEVLVEEAFHPNSGPENAEIARRLGDVSGLTILDLGCGAGEATAFFARRGARVVATDLSPGMTRLARATARLHSGAEVRAFAGSATALALAADSVDVVYGYGVLHHVDLERAAAEIARVLKPGGRAFFIDPLAYNPAIWVYRLLARAVRTEGEAPLRFRDLRAFRRRFAAVRHDEYWLAALWVYFHYFFFEWKHPGRVRYWKQVLRDRERLGRLLGPLHRLDRLALRVLPFLRPLCWNMLTEAHDPKPEGKGQ